ncbi:Glutamate synthase (NADPH) [Thiorhodococcus drewsii AZ1]|uniref:Glutamate synthase (NADPH) n=1 Tax=Thiorhodococcus drewsii AZ1 TaxID=765913 RepID=G2E2B7_9GAMM|nr:FMN-binding glutamate synthase family protein [Thiorhodococcus drewsii]EGV30833.1 Glutamate synthase (NADPH) [Thiorhodococcus drewsii AZ1]
MTEFLHALKRAVVPLLALLASIVAALVAPDSTFALMVYGLSACLVSFGLIDLFQRGNAVIRNYPVAGHLRFLAYRLRPFLRQYIVEDDLEGTPLSFEARNLVKARASGETDTQPFGSERAMDAGGYIWISHSIAPSEESDTDPRVRVGNDQCRQPYEASVLNISAMSFGALSARAIEALNLGAAKGGFYHDTGEGGLSDYHLKHGGDLVWELGSGYFGARDRQGHFDPESFRDKAQEEAVRMTEIKLSQGAKPGHGGLLPAAKVTAEVASVRQVAAHRDCLSPRGHSAFSTPIGLLEFAARMRELSGGKPVGIKLCVGQPHEVMALMKAMLKTGILLDFIVVDGAEGGTGAAPLELSDWVGMPLNEGLAVVRNALAGSGLRRHVRLAASGKVYSGMGIAHNLAMGADWCNAARAFMFSIGCIQSKRCHLGTCPTGVATQDRWRQHGLVPSVQGERAARFHRKTIEALVDITAACGLTHPADLQPHHLAIRTGAAEAKPLDELQHFLPEGILLEDPQSTQYAEFWEAADPDTFAPRIDLTERRVSIDTRNTGLFT